MYKNVDSMFLSNQVKSGRGSVFLTNPIYTSNERADIDRIPVWFVNNG